MNRPIWAYAGDKGVTYAWADGSIIPESEFALSPDQVKFVTHYGPGDKVKPAAAVVTRIGEPASKEDEFDVMLQVKGQQDVEWGGQGPGVGGRVTVARERSGHTAGRADANARRSEGHGVAHRYSHGTVTGRQDHRQVEGDGAPCAAPLH